MRTLSPDRKRNCNTEKDFDPLANKSQQVCLPIEQEEYDQILSDSVGWITVWAVTVWSARL